MSEAPHRALGPALARTGLGLASVLLLASGCGGGEGDLNARAEPAAKPDDATAACRQAWKDLGDDVADEAAQTDPSALPQRWNTVAATVDYYAHGAKGSDCDSRLADQRKAIAALRGFETKLRPYDMEQRSGSVLDAAEAYAAGPSPAKAKGASTKARPKPAQVAAAVRRLTAQAPLATRDQGPAWQQAAVTELSDPAAVKKAVKDLAFLSGESKAYRTCTRALATVKAALAAKK